MIAVVHDLTPLVLRGLHPPLYKTFFWIGLQTLRLADQVVTVSDNTRLDLVRLSICDPRRVSVIPEGPGISPTDAEPVGRRRRDSFVLYVGGYLPHKNTPRLLMAMARIPKASRPPLILVGNGPTEPVKAMAHRLGLAKTTIVMTDVDDAALSRLYSNCRLFVFPSLYEGFGLPVLEALAHGAPVLCSQNSSLPEVAGDCALYFNPWSTRDICCTIQRALGDEGLLSDLSSRGETRASLFSWSRTGALLLSKARTALASRMRRTRSH